LKALYESTDGDNWTDNTGWEAIKGDEPPVGCDLENLKGIILDVNRRVKNLLLFNNQLKGRIPAELGNLSNLSILNLSSNQLNGTIPPQLGNLSKLTQTTLNNNQLSGSIPLELGNLSNLIFLSLYNNQLNGRIPFELGNLSKLTSLNLFENRLNGSIPPELGNLNNLNLLFLNNNQLSGCYNVNLTNLCDKGFINGTISDGNNLDAPWEDFCAVGAGANCEPRPNCHIDDWTALKALYENTTGDNWLNNSGWGVINENVPPVDCDLENLNGVWLDVNGRVVQLSLNNNQLSGSIPVELGNLSNLKRLDLYINQLSGSIPAELGNLSKLTHLGLYNNQLIESIPTD